MLTEGIRTVKVHTQLVQLASPVPTTVRVGWVGWTVGRLVKNREMMELFVFLR